MKKTLAMLLALSLTATILLSCTQSPTETQEETQTPETNLPEETDEVRITPDLPDITFDGADFRFYQFENGERYPYFREILVEEVNGEPVNDAVYERNNIIEDRYKVKITFRDDPYGTFAQNIRNYVNADEDVYDVMLPMGHVAAAVYTSNVFYNLRDINYLDFEKPWWDQNSLDSFTLSGYTPFAVSDMLLNAKTVTSTVLFNKKLAEDFHVGNLYDEVYNNNWTIETMINKGKMVSQDLNGDGKYDDNDLFGIITGDEAVLAFFHSAGGRIADTDSDGNPILTFKSDYNFTAIMYYLEELMFDPILTRNNTAVPNSVPAIDMFKADQGLFLINILTATQYLRDMESDFGILPIPKYMDTQENYSNTVSVFEGSLIGVPINTRNLEMIGVIVEAMSAESKYTVIPALYDTVFKGKSTRDQDSVAMLDIILNSMAYDVGQYLGLAGFEDRFLRITGNVQQYVNPGYPERTSNIASFYATYESMLNAELEELIAIIDGWKNIE